MKIYVHDPKDNNFLNCSSASVSCSKAELNYLINGLISFRSKIDNYIKNNPNESDFGKSYMHYIDINEICKNSENDLIFIVDMNTAKEDIFI